MTTNHENPNPLNSGLRDELKKLLDGGQAHATFEAAVKDMPAKLQGVVPEGLPYSAWQILEHIRIAQRDILDFSRNSDSSYQPRKWPDSYWPEDTAPPSEDAWNTSLHHVREDRNAFEAVLKSADDTELVATFPWGDGQTLLHEAFLIAAHTSYHTGELIVVRRLLGAWTK